MTIKVNGFLTRYTKDQPQTSLREGQVNVLLVSPSENLIEKVAEHLIGVEKDYSLKPGHLSREKTFPLPQENLGREREVESHTALHPFHG